MFRLVCALIATSLTVCACMSGPDYTIPENAVAKSKNADGPFIGASSDGIATLPLPDHWWRLYEDERLDGYVVEALRANADLRAADANLARATAIVSEVKAQRLPSTQITGCSIYNRLGGCSPTQKVDGGSYSLGAAVAYPLDLAGGVTRAIEQAKANHEAVAAIRDSVRLTVVAAVARNYVEVCSSNRSLAAVKRVVMVQEQTLDAVQKLSSYGRATPFDVSRAQAAADQSAAAVPSILAQRQASLYALAALMGKPSTKYPREMEDCPLPPMIRRPLPVGDGAGLIRRRPDIRAAERELAGATAGIGVQTAQLYPEITLVGTIAMIGPPRVWGGSIGPLLSWSWPNHVAVRARINEAGAEADAASADFDGSVLKALQQVETALDTYAKQIQATAQLTAARDDAQKAASQAGKLFRFGRTDLLSLLQAEAALSASETSLANGQSALADDQTNVFISLGGGWEP
ncbi:efflux transporter outer membrane subunit [Paraburkholderia sp. C35]|uniref:efflux transporter outer membrane subunit n=1 Tax=Paraburkholderia sp. C35 TaxID=2126993 RepID=UPI000D69CC5F|nr:efflux transporter outer membrane subunit [Paraburkholderia sp. C35]